MFNRKIKAKVFKIRKGNHDYIRTVTGKLVDDIELDYSQFDFDELETMLGSLFEYIGIENLSTRSGGEHVEVFDGNELLLVVADVAY